MGKVESEAEAIYDKMGRGSATDVKTIRDALLAAEKRGREEAAGVAQECSKNVSGPTTREAICAEVASTIRSGS